MYGVPGIAGIAALLMVSPESPPGIPESGGAPGVDNAFATACRELGIVAEPHLADWGRE
jgi:hypothetical protein